MNSYNRIQVYMKNSMTMTLQQPVDQFLQNGNLRNIYELQKAKLQRKGHSPLLLDEVLFLCLNLNAVIETAQLRDTTSCTAL